MEKSRVLEPFIFVNNRFLLYWHQKYLFNMELSLFYIEYLIKKDAPLL